MREMIQRKPKTVTFFTVILFIIMCFLFIIFSKPKAQWQDYRLIFSRQYDTVFLSMYPADTYCEEDFLTYRGMTMYKASYCIPDFSTLKEYMKLITKSGNTISTVYLGIRPDKADLEGLQKLIDSCPGASFEIILAYPSAEYWKSLSAEEYTSLIEAYSNFLSAAPTISSSHVYFVSSQEWLIANPGNYDREWLVNESVAQSLMLQCDYLQGYYVTAENAPSFSQELIELTQKVRNTTVNYPDLSDYRLIFLGDSVIGNFTDSTSIPEIAVGLTGASVFNCGLGGSSAAMPDSAIALPAIADAFIHGDLSLLAEGSQVYRGVSSYLSSPPSDQKLCFIIYYGLNDYFCGYPISSENDPYDTATYCGAIRTVVKSIRSSFQDAQIILCTPNYIFYLDYGTIPQGEGNYVLEDYVKAIFSLSEELQTDVLDTYHNFGVNQSNWVKYIPDQVHPNAAYRYLIVEKLIGLIR